MTPTAEQLDHLIGHTDHRALTPDEHAALRAGVQALRRHKEAAEDALTRVLHLAEQLPADTRDQIHAAIGTSPAQIVARWCLREELEQAETRIAAVRTLHQPRDHGGWQICAGCSKPGHVTSPWPCPTIATLDGSGE
jgi:hypothetical protein